MDDSDVLPTISGHDVIMAYGGEQRHYVQHGSDRRCCTFLFWCRLTLLVLSFLVWGAGVTMIGLGAWALVNSSGLELFETLLAEPSWMLIGTGIVMVAVGVVGCAGALRLNIICLRVFMVLVIAVFVLQLALAAVVFFLMDDMQSRMLDVMKDAVTNYDRDLNIARDEALDYLQREFSCCGGSSYSDWESNRYFNCNSFVSPSCCGVPSSCCITSRDVHCGDGVRSRAEESAAVVIYTQGCIVSVMRVFRDNVTVVAAISFSICLIEIICLILANVIGRHIVLHRKLIS